MPNNTPKTCATPSNTMSLHDDLEGKPCYMGGQASIDENGNIWTQTHAECHWDLKGFTGGMSVLFFDISNVCIYQTPVIQVGVDGKWVGDWSRTVETTFKVDPAIYFQTNTMIIHLGHAGHNRLWDDLGQAISVIGMLIEDIIEIITACTSDDPVNDQSTSDPGTDDPTSGEDALGTYSSNLIAASNPPVLDIPALTSPGNGTHLTNHPRTTNFTWQPVPGATGYILEVQYSWDGGNSWSASAVYKTANTSQEMTFWGDQPGRWRVAAIDDSHTHQRSPASSWWIFDYVPLPVLPTPALLLPANNARLTNIPALTLFSWKPVPGATGYFVEAWYSTDGGNTMQPISIGTVHDTQTLLLFPGPYTGAWRVTALDSTGKHQASKPSDTWKFDYTATKQLKTPVIVSPVDGAKLPDSPRTLTLEWQPVEGATGYLVQVHARRIKSLVSSARPVTDGGRVISCGAINLDKPIEVSPLLRMRQADPANKSRSMYGDLVSVKPKNSATGSSLSELLEWTSLLRVTTSSVSLTFDFIDYHEGRWNVMALDNTGAYLHSKFSPSCDFKFG